MKSCRIVPDADASGNDLGDIVYGKGSISQDPLRFMLTSQNKVGRVGLD